MTLPLQMAGTEADHNVDGSLTDGHVLASQISRGLSYAYQPIVCIRSGQCFGFEAIARGHEQLGFPSVAALRHHLYRSGGLGWVDAILQEKAVATAADLLRRTRTRLFFHLDNRILQLPDYAPHRTTEILADHGLDPATLCLELSERHAGADALRVSDVLRYYRHHAYLFALDDFGTGYSGLQLLYDHHPDIVKIDRLFIHGLDEDDRKRLFVRTIVNLAHILGITVVAKGIETETEFRACKQVGCNLVQGDFIAQPTTDLATLHECYPIVAETNRRERRERRGDQRLMRDELVRLPTLSLTDSMTAVFEAFRVNINCGFFPVLDNRGYPIGVVREKDIKPYIYSPFGKELLRNKASGRTLRSFISSANACDVNTDAEMILAMYAHAPEPAPILVTENFRYLGVLRPESLLKVINEKNLINARDQNPLTRLPGNNPITDYLAEMLDDADTEYVLVYFDLDHFKPFNDILGFRQGDRAILMFADVLRLLLSRPNIFIGHIGGDDFFAGIRGLELEQAKALVQEVLALFGNNIESFYDAETRARGTITAIGRDGEPATFPLLGCSAAVVQVPTGPREANLDHIVAIIADIKKAAKASPNHLSCRRLSGPAVP